MVKKYRSIIISVIILLLIGFFIYKNRAEFSIIKNISWIYIVPLFILSFLMYWVNGLVFAYFTEIFKKKLTFSEYTGLSIIGGFSNFFTPFQVGGISVKAYYLKKKHKMRYADFVSIFAGSSFIWLLTSSFWGFFGVVMIFFIAKIFSLKLLLFFIVLGAGVSLLFFITPYIKKSGNKYLMALKNSFKGWEKIKKNKTLLLKVSAVLSANYFISALQLYFACLAFQAPVDFFVVFIVRIISGLSMVIALTPGNLGIQESLTATVFVVLKATGFTTGFLSASLIRVVSTVMLFILGPVYSHILIKKYKN